MMSLLALLLVTAQPSATGFTEHGRAFVTLLTCAEHTIGFSTEEKQQLMDLAFDLSDGAKALASEDDLSFVIGMTEQQELLAEQANKAQSHIYNSLNAQVSTYLDKASCQATEQSAQALLEALKERLPE
ncbi:hypothetical protein [Rheinheimera nanhaiensis]|nr:hypothetical protein [Rheinheimera nanhaiensis]